MAAEVDARSLQMYATPQASPFDARNLRIYTTPQASQSFDARNLNPSPSM